jgi:hypothetical protein
MGEGPLPEHPVKHHDELIVYAWVDFLPALKDGDSYCAMQEKSPA